MSDFIALAGRIRASLLDVDVSVERVTMLMKKALRTNDDGFWDGVALNLHGFYTGIEHIFEDIARTIEGGLPSGSEWHIDLLIQMSIEMVNLRPAIITEATQHCLDEYRGLRHVIRNVYAFKLQPIRLHELAKGLPNCYEAVKKDLIAFAGFLESID